jgi:hypothetical protein
LSGLLAAAQLSPTHFLCENLPDPIAIDAPQPRFSWQLEGLQPPPDYRVPTGCAFIFYDDGDPENHVIAGRLLIH